MLGGSRVPPAPSPRHDGKDLHLAGKPLQLVHSTVFELDARAGDEILDGAGDEHLARPGERGHACTRVDGNAGDVAVVELALAGVEPGTNREPERHHAVADGGRAPDRASRAVEGREEAVAGRVDLVAAEALE